MRTSRASTGARAASSTDVRAAAERSALERALLRDRWIVGGSLAIAVALSWSWIVPMALDMYGPMSGAAAWMMTARWDLAHLALLFAMWLVMMIGMMLPSAAPALLIYAAVVRRSPDGRDAVLRTYLFAAGYLLAWSAFSALATALQRALTAHALVSPMMEASHPAVAGALLIAAGAYQLTPLKRACLQSCRSPAAFVTANWQVGRSGAWRMGVRHGLYCLGCCWVLMLLLFVGGVMSLLCIAAITVFVLAEKLLPLPAQGGRASGALLVLAGVWLGVVGGFH
jgi:predicted metal-binding membrane protein